MRTNAPARPSARGVASIVGIALIVQACGGGDAATQPQSTPTSVFTLSATPVTILQGADGESKVEIARSGGFTGAVSLEVGRAPLGVSASITPNVTTGSTATVVVTVSPEAGAGRVNLTITGTAPGRTDQKATVAVTIMPYDGGTGNVTLDFSACPPAQKPMWFAAQDGAAPWRQIVGSGDVYRLQVDSSRGGYAFVVQGYQKGVYATLQSRSELSGTIARCGGRASKSVSGTLVGMNAGDVAFVGLGGGLTDPDGGPAPRSFVLSGVLDGKQDFIAYRSNPETFPVTDRAIIRRDQDIPNNGSVGTVNFGASESFAPATAALTVTGVPFVRYSMAYLTGPDCAYSSLFEDPSGGTGFVLRGIPPTQQRASDFHFLTASVGTSDYRAVSESFHTLTNRVMAFPAPLPRPTITTLPGGHKRLQASLVLPSEYQRSLELYYLEPQGGTAWVTASFTWLGGSAATLAFPDLSGVTGWRSSFLPSSSASVSWSIGATGTSVAGASSACVENARYVSAYVSGQE